jgi:hypothetical protein
MGVILWHRIEFLDEGVTVSNDIFEGDLVLDADVTVEYGVGKPGTLHAEIANLPLEITNKLAEAVERSSEGPRAGTTVAIQLGYFDGGPKETAVIGRLDRVWTENRDRPVTVIEGYESAAFRLLNSIRASVGGPATSVSKQAPKLPTKQIVDEILAPAGVKAAGIVTPTSYDLPTISMVGENAFDLLERFARRVGAEVLVEEEQVLFGTGIFFPAGSGLPIPPNPSALRAFMTAENSLVTIDPVGAGRLADFKPLVLLPRAAARTAVGRPAQESVHAFDFVVLGLPALRAGALVVATVSDYANPFNPFRIIDLTHNYSRRSGYVCSGRAVRFDPGADAGLNRQLTELGRRASAASVARRLMDRADSARVTHPSIDVGRLKSAKHDKRVATFHYPQEQSVKEATPSVDLDISQNSAQVFDKPILSPFAWHKVGLSVPLYPGMRALLAQRHDVREDAIAAGFLWANKPQMDRPAADEGDWWLCLPTELGGDGLPTGKGANDLVAKDGRRVIEARSLRVCVGQTKLSAVGNRPTEADADKLVIEHTSGTTVTIDDQGAVELKANKPIKLTSGQVTLTVGDGKVSVS